MNPRMETMQSAAAATGNGTSLVVEGQAVAGFQVTGTFVGTVTFETSIDETNWVALECKSQADGSVATTATAPGIYVGDVAGRKLARARVSAWVSGTITVVGLAVEAGGGTIVADVDIVTGEIIGITAASGAIASGAVASGAVASGAYASGSIASGAMAAGSQADGHSATLGTTTDAAASSTVAEDATARTSIALWKGLKNILLLLNAKFADLGQAAMAASMPVVIANNQSAVAVDATGQGDVPVTLDSEQVAIADADAYTTPTHTAVNVTTSTGEVLASNANRLYALLVNDSDTVIYIKLGAAAVANQGIRINANGGNYEMSAMLGNLYTGAINGIHAGTGNKVLLMTEGV